MRNRRAYNSMEIGGFISESGILSPSRQSLIPAKQMYWRYYWKSVKTQGKRKFVKSNTPHEYTTFIVKIYVFVI